MKALLQLTSALTLLALLVCCQHVAAQKPDEDAADSWVAVDLREAPCTLHDFGERPDGQTHGLRVWFGRQLQLICSFYAAERDLGRKGSVLTAGGMISGDETPLYYAYSVAFFDADDNLLACDGGDIGPPTAITGPFTSLTRNMPVAQGVNKEVKSYRVAYYESERPIGEAAWRENKPVLHSKIDGDTGGVTKRTWPAWKSDGELLGKTVKIRKEPRRFLESTEKNWSVITVEGPITFSATADTRPPRNQGKPDDAKRLASGDNSGKQSIIVDKGTALKAELRAHLSPTNQINLECCIQNSSSSEMLGMLYIAFFDKYGNLIGGTHMDTAIAPNATSPAVTIDGKGFALISAFQGMKDIPLPRRLEQKIVAYKATLYEIGLPSTNAD